MSLSVLLATAVEPELVTPWWVGLLIALGFASFGVPCMALGIRAIQRDRAMRTWPQAQGVVTASEVTASQVSGKDSRGVVTWSNNYTADVSYIYTVDDVMHETGKLEREVMQTGQAAGPQAKVDAYPVGSEISAYYNPEDPAEAYVELKISWGGIFLTVFGAPFAALGVLALVLTIMGV